MIDHKPLSRFLSLVAAAAVVALGLMAGVPAQAQVPGTALVYQQKPGGAFAAENVIAAAVIKASPTSIVRIVVISPGTTSGSLTLNDAASTGAATTANEVFTMGFAALSVGQVITLEVRCAVGLVVSAVPGAGSPQYVITYT